MKLDTNTINKIAKLARIKLSEEEARDLLKDMNSILDWVEQLNEVISVEEVGIFKPDVRVYKLVEERFYCQREEVLFGSSNCWDAIAAAEFGFKTVWVNRSRQQIDRLSTKKLIEVSDLSKISDFIC